MAPGPGPRARWLDDDEQRAWRAFLRAYDRLMTRLERDLSPFGLTMDQYAILVVLSETADGSLRMGELAETIYSSRSRLTYVVSQLEARQLVARRACSWDRRGTLAQITPDGLDLLHRAAPVHVDGVRRSFVDVLGRQRLLALGRALDTVWAELEAHPQRAGRRGSSARDARPRADAAQMTGGV